MITTKQEIKARILKEDRTLTSFEAQEFVDQLFPSVGMDVIVETDDDEIETKP